MKIPIITKTNLPKVGLEPCEALHKRVPTRDKEGNRLVDFMILIPKLENRSEQGLKKVINNIQRVFKLYEDVVVFADLNLKINILWVSIKARPGFIVKIAAELHKFIPEVKLVGEYIKKN